MARPRTPSNILAMKGAFKANPQRARNDEPEGAGEFADNAPKHLSTSEKCCWDEIVKIVPAGVLTGSDLIQVEIVACLLSRFRTERAEMPAQLLTRLCSEMGKIGLSPSARAGLQIDKPKKNEFEE